ncbi:MAG: hypothetical protein WC297_02680 [Candidatus Paceibacterota bacterium]|jgi:hypothetical protein
MKKGNVWVGILIVIAVLCFWKACFTIGLSKNKKDVKQHDEMVYNAGFAAGQAAAKIDSTIDKGGGRIYRVTGVKFSKNPHKNWLTRITVVGVNEEHEASVSNTNVYINNEANSKIFNPFKSAKFVVMGEDGNLIPLSPDFVPSK